MIDKKTVFVLGAGASCPYGYPSGSQLREDICLRFKNRYIEYLNSAEPNYGAREDKISIVDHFAKTFLKSRIQSIDLFLANNRRLASTGKYIIAFEILEIENKSHSLEQSYQLQQDWYLYLFNRFIRGITTGDRLPDFSNGKIGFITFNYDRSLENLLYESLRNSFNDIPEHEIYRCLKSIEIIHVYGQIAPLQWQNQADYVGYGTPLNEALLKKISCNIKTIYEEEKTSALEDAHDMLEAAERVFFLGFGYAPENMEILKLPRIISKTSKFYGTAFGLESREIQDIFKRVHDGLQQGSHLKINPHEIKLEKEMDCLKLLRNYF
ncbi:MAG: hypothetical protein JW749_12170 [Sedimentisphaerales bacterium]|nr:hypothetical protein [Sedimentisphaerales bacterium]